MPAHMLLMTDEAKGYVSKFLYNWEVSGALYLQSTIVGVMSIGGFHVVRLPNLSKLV